MKAGNFIREILYCGMCLLSVFFLGFFLEKGQAQAAESLEIAIPFEIKASGDVPYYKEVYKIRLKAETEGAPLPEGKSGSVYTMKAEGTGAFFFPEITYDTPGIYEYTIWQVPGTDKSCEYDTARFHVKVTVVHSEDGTELEETVVVQKEQKTRKLAEAVFREVYELDTIHGHIMDIKVKKVWKDNGQNRPESVTVVLRDGDKTESTISLGEWNNWSYTWEGKQVSGDWSVEEVNIPQNYQVSYERTENLFTVTNTEYLIQTGQTKWPVPVILAAGICLVLTGTVLMKKKKTEKQEKHHV